MSEYLQARIAELTEDQPIHILEELIALYKVGSLADLNDLRDALFRGDHAAIARAAKDLTGSSRNVGAEAVCLVSQQLIQVDSLERERAWDLVDQIDRRLQMVYAEMDSYLAARRASL